MKKRILLLLTLAFAFCLGAQAQTGFAGTQGAPYTGGGSGCPSEGMFLDKSTPQVFVSGNPRLCQPISETLSSVSAQTALTNVTTAQALFTFTPQAAGLMNFVGRAIRIKGKAIFSNGVTTPAITISVAVGATTVCTIATAANANSNTNSPLEYEFTITTAATGSSGNDYCEGWVKDTVSAAWSSGTAVAEYTEGSNAVSSNYDHTAKNNFVTNIASTATLTSVTELKQTIELVF